MRVAAQRRARQTNVRLARCRSRVNVAGRRKRIAYGTQQHENQGEQHARRTHQATPHVWSELDSTSVEKPYSRDRLLHVAAVMSNGRLSCAAGFDPRQGRLSESIRNHPVTHQLVPHLPVDGGSGYASCQAIRMGPGAGQPPKATTLNSPSPNTSNGRTVIQARALFDADAISPAIDHRFIRCPHRQSCRASNAALRATSSGVRGERASRHLASGPRTSPAVTAGHAVYTQFTHELFLDAKE